MKPTVRAKLGLLPTGHKYLLHQFPRLRGLRLGVYAGCAQPSTSAITITTLRTSPAVRFIAFPSIGWSGLSDGRRTCLVVSCR